MDTVNQVVIGLAAFAILLGLALYFWSVTARGRPHFNTTSIIAWLLIALFPVLILFLFFPESEAHGSIFGISVTGAVALFLVIWHQGVKHSRIGRSLDDLERRIGVLDAEKSDLADKLKSARASKPELLAHAVHTYAIDGAPGKSLAVITGDLMDVKDCNCWVNSENNYMEMARFPEKAISAVIRYYGARRNKAGGVVDDLIADQLRDTVRIAKGLEPDSKLAGTVEPRSVFLTSAGELEQSHGVKIIAHVASVTGEVGDGWRPIENIHRCVSAVLEAVEESDRAVGVQTLLFPLMGTGQAGGRQERGELVCAQMREAVRYLADHAESKVKRVCFLAWSAGAFDACRRAVASLPNVHEDAV